MKPSPTYSQSLLFWSFFVPACAAPAFLLAYGYGFNTPSAFLGMVFGAAIYIFLFAAIDAFGPQSGRLHTVFRAIRWAVKVRACVALLSLITPFSFLMVPDLYAGMAATSSAGLIGSRTMGAIFGSGENNGFWATSLTTLFGGFYVFLTVLLITPAVYAFVAGLFKRTTIIQPAME